MEKIQYEKLNTIVGGSPERQFFINTDEVSQKDFMITLRQARLKKSKTFISKSSYPGCEGAILYNLVCSGKFISSGIAVSLFGMDFEWPTDSFPVSEDLGKLFADDVFKGDSEDK